METQPTSKLKTARLWCRKVPLRCFIRSMSPESNSRICVRMRAKLKRNSSSSAASSGTKPQVYALIPDDDIIGTTTLDGLLAWYVMS